MQKNNQFFKTLNKLDLALQRMKAKSETVRMFYEMGQMENAYEEALELEEAAEQLVLLARALPAYTGSPWAMQAVEDCMKRIVPVQIGYTEQGWFSIRMPLLLPKKTDGTAEYIRGILYPVMRDFFMEKLPARYEKCVLVYRHVYDRARPERQWRDHDNIEINMVSDIVAMYVLPDDGPEVCSHYYTSAASSVERTEVYVVPQEEFESFLEAENSMPDKGVALYENEP